MPRLSYLVQLRGVDSYVGFHFVRHELIELWRLRSLMWVMTQREMKSRYAGSAAGLAWAYLQPLAMVAAYFLVFDVVFSMRMGSSSPVQRVGVYLVVGSLPWLIFCESLSRGASSLVEAGSLLQKNALPTALFVARSVLAGWLVFVPLMSMLTLAYLPVSGWGSALLALPGLLLLQGLIAFVLAYVLAILAAATRDTLQVLGFALSVGIFLSPVLFPLSLFPQEWRWVLFANPMTALVIGYQSVLLQGSWPASTVWFVSLGWLLVLLFALNALLRRSHDELVDWL